MTEFVFAAPLWMTLTAVAVGLALAGYGLLRGDKNARIVGLVVLLIGAAWLVASKVVETGSERTTRRSRELVEAVDRKDWDAVGSYLENGVTLSIAKQPTKYDGKDQLLMAGRLATFARSIPALSVGTVEPRVEGDLITTTVQVKTTSEATGGFSTPTVWRFVWQRTGDEWFVREIEGVDMGALGDGVSKYLPKVGG